MDHSTNKRKNTAVIKIGVLSDSHRQCPDAEYLAHCEYAFGDCEIIIHAGDLVDISVLEPFRDKQIFAVAGNMCNLQARTLLPTSRNFTIDGVHFGLCHGTGARHNIGDRMFDMFPDAGCIIFGHSHQPMCSHVANTLLVNPGSFLATSRYGNPGSYAILELTNGKINATIHFLPAQ